MMNISLREKIALQVGELVLANIELSDKVEKLTSDINQSTEKMNEILSGDLKHPIQKNPE